MAGEARSRVTVGRETKVPIFGNKSTVLAVRMTVCHAKQRGYRTPHGYVVMLANVGESEHGASHQWGSSSSPLLCPRPPVCLPQEEFDREMGVAARNARTEEYLRTHTAAGVTMLDPTGGCAPALPGPHRPPTLHPTPIPSPLLERATEPPDVHHKLHPT